VFVYALVCGGKAVFPHVRDSATALHNHCALRLFTRGTSPVLAFRPRWDHPSGAMIADYSATPILKLRPTAGFTPAVGVIAV